MRTSIRLADYEEILELKDIYSLIGLTTFYNKHYRECSKAFTKLETMKGINQEIRDKYSDVALSIFSVCNPKNPKAKTIPCPNCKEEVRDFQTNCGNCGTTFPACVASGRPIIEFNQRLYKCKGCSHQSFEHALRGFTTCPLCHTSLI